MRRIGLRSRSWMIAAICVALGVGNSAGGFADAARAVSPPSSTSIPVTVTSTGWIVYGNLLSTSLNLIAPSTKTITGTVDSAGTCSFSDSGSYPAGSTGTFEEEAAYNPTTCQEKLISGGLTAASLATLNSLTPANPNTPSRSFSKSVRVKHLTSTVRASATYKSDYTKSAYIDPILITITSFTSNLKWPLYGAAGTGLYGRYNPYQFAWDLWSNTGTPNKNFYRTYSPNGYALQGAESFYNRDFEALLVYELGVAAIALCNGIGAATFNFDETTYGRFDGSAAYSTNHSKSGGCTNLTHYNHWAGFGWSS